MHAWCWNRQTRLIQWTILYTLCIINQEHKIGSNGFIQIRSNTTTNPIIISTSNPGLTSRLNTSFANTTVALALFLEILATSSPLELNIQQFRWWNEPSIRKSGSWDCDGRNTTASSLLLCKRWLKLLLIEKILDLELFPWRIDPSSLYAFHWPCKLHICR